MTRRIDCSILLLLLIIAVKRKCMTKVQLELKRAKILLYECVRSTYPITIGLADKIVEAKKMHKMLFKEAYKRFIFMLSIMGPDQAIAEVVEHIEWFDREYKQKHIA